MEPKVGCQREVAKRKPQKFKKHDFCSILAPKVTPLGGSKSRVTHLLDTFLSTLSFLEAFGPQGGLRMYPKPWNGCQNGVPEPATIQMCLKCCDSWLGGLPLSLNAWLQHYWRAALLEGVPRTPKFSKMTIRPNPIENDNASSRLSKTICVSPLG